MQFSPITTAEWREKLQKDSKGSATYESLHWQTPEGIQLAPFYHYDSAPESPVIPFAKSENTWLINEIVRVETPAAANALALSALAGGAESLQFVIDSPLTLEMMRQLLDSIFIDMIRLSFSGTWVSRNAINVWQLYQTILTERGLAPQAVNGCIAADITDIYSLNTLKETLTEYSNIHIVALHGAGNNEAQLSGIIDAVKRLVAHDPQFAERLQISVPVGNSFMLEVAKLRALRLLWHTEISSTIAPFIHAFTAPSALTTDVNYNKIAATTQAMSAIMGGADQLTVTPADSALTANSDVFSRRMARNVQHILRLESHLDKVLDPAAGSYYIDTITQALCTQVRATL